MGVGLIDDFIHIIFIHDILSVPFCPAQVIFKCKWSLFPCFPAL